MQRFSKNWGVVIFFFFQTGGEHVRHTICDERNAGADEA